MIVELQTAKTTKLFGSKKNYQTTNVENIPSLEIVEVILAQYNLVGHQYQQTSVVLYTFTPKKSDA